MKKRTMIVAATSVLALTLSISAFSDKSNEKIETAADIVPSMLSKQSVEDILPSRVAIEFQGLGADLQNARLLGENDEAAFYAVSMKESQICIITVNADEKPSSMGCTTVDGFDTYGLRVSNSDNSVQGWLTTPGAVTSIENQRAGALGKEAAMTWIKKSDIFLISG